MRRVEAKRVSFAGRKIYKAVIKGGRRFLLLAVGRIYLMRRGRMISSMRQVSIILLVHLNFFYVVIRVFIFQGILFPFGTLWFRSGGRATPFPFGLIWFF